jgi:cytochrome c oxidase subunit 2
MPLSRETKKKKKEILMISSKINKKRVLVQWLMIGIIAIGILIYSGGSGLVVGSDSVQDLPQGTVQLTPSIPGMGEHWANPDDMPLGPIYLLYKGEVIGVEFMYTQEMLTEVRIPTPQGEEIFSELANLEVKHAADHLDVGFMPEGHAGFEVPHWDVHIYFVRHAEHLSITAEPVTEVKEITITAKRFEYEPNSITVNQGDTVRLKIKSIDATHGFGLPEFGINVKLRKGETVVVEFVADKKGTFEFRCTNYCGEGHGEMKGKLVVE